MSISRCNLWNIEEVKGLAESLPPPPMGAHNNLHRGPVNTQLHQKTRRQLRRISAAGPLRADTSERDVSGALVGGMLKKRIEEKLAKLELMQMLANIEVSNSHISLRNSRIQSTTPERSLSQRRGLNVRRIAVDSRPVDTTQKAQTRASAVTVDKLQHERGSIGLRSDGSPFNIGFCLRSRPKCEQGTVRDDYQRVKTNDKTHDSKGKDRDSRASRTQKRVLRSRP